MTFDRLFGKTGWVVMMLLATAVALLSTRYLLPNPPRVGPNILPNFEANTAIFLTHVVGSVIALLIGPWQFVATIRRRWTRLHRWMGRIYMVAVLFGGIGGFFIAWTTTAGPLATAGFSLLAVIWLGTTGLGYQSARAGNYADHRKWMIRSFALTAAAITLRLGLPIAPALGYSFLSGYMVMSWACWIINLGIAELLLRSGENRKTAVA